MTAVIGTHTHVQTNDARVLPGGTAAITDAGMTGPHDSVIGVKAELAIQRMRTGMPVRFEPAEGGVRIEGALVECDADGRALELRAGSRSPCRRHAAARRAARAERGRARGRARTGARRSASARSQ